MSNFVIVSPKKDTLAPGSATSTGPTVIDIDATRKSRPTSKWMAVRELLSAVSWMILVVFAGYALVHYYPAYKGHVYSVVTSGWFYYPLVTLATMIAFRSLHGRRQRQILLLVVGAFILYLMSRTLPALVGPVYGFVTKWWVFYPVLGLATYLAYRVLRTDRQRQVLLAVVGLYVAYKMATGVWGLMTWGFGSISGGWLFFGLKFLPLVLAFIFFAWVLHYRGIEIPWSTLWKYSQHDMVLVLIAWGGFWIATDFVFGDWWEKRWSENLYKLLSLVAIMTYAAMIKKPPKYPLKWKVGGLLLIYAAVVFANFIFLEGTYSDKAWEEQRVGFKEHFFGLLHDIRHSRDEKKTEGKSPNTPSPSTMSSYQKAMALDLDRATYNLDNSFPEELVGTELTDDETVRKNARLVYDTAMSLKNLPIRMRYNVFWICGYESKFQQKEGSSDEPFIGRDGGNEPNGAVSICMVKPAVWGEKSKELSQSSGMDYSVNTIEGSVRLAGYIVQNEGYDQFAKSRRVRARERLAEEKASKPAEATAQAEDEPEAPEPQQAKAPRKSRETGDVVSYTNVQPMKLEMPRGGEFSAPLKCLTDNCSIHADNKVAYWVEGRPTFATGDAGVDYPLPKGKTVRFLDGRRLPLGDTSPSAYVVFTP